MLRNLRFLDAIARHLAAQLDCTQDLTCRQIIQMLTETGQPIAPTHLATLLQMSQEELATHLARIPGRFWLSLPVRCGAQRRSWKSSRLST